MNKRSNPTKYNNSKLQFTDADEDSQIDNSQLPFDEADQKQPKPYAIEQLKALIDSG